MITRKPKLLLECTFKILKKKFNLIFKFIINLSEKLNAEKMFIELEKKKHDDDNSNRIELQKAKLMEILVNLKFS